MATQKGYFLIADITGYTSYLSASELDHAQQILTSLLNLLIQHTKPPLIISRLAGDAVISYGLSDSFIKGQTFVETLEATYVSFRRAIDLMVRNTTCPCNACRNISSLDLKFFVHFGEFSVQKLDAHDELVGSDVILIHRLLKNHVTEALGIKAYTLYTAAAVEQLGLEELAGLIPHEESYENFGTVAVLVQDMHPVWEAKRREVLVKVTPDREAFRGSTEIAMPPERVWDYLLNAKYFNVLVGGEKIEITGVKAGRVSVGSVYECYHGGGVISQTVVEWHPFEQMTVQFAVPIPIKGVTGLVELRLEPTERGTRLIQIFSKTSGPLAGRVVGDLAMKQVAKSIQKDIDAFRDAVEADVSERAAGMPPAATIAESAVGAAALASLRGAEAVSP